MYQKAMPAGAAGYVTPSYGMEAILNPSATTNEEPAVTPVEPQGPTKITSWLIVDHNNFAQAVQNQLVDYYNNYPTEAAQDGQTWPPFTASKFPWLVINYNFDGDSEVIVKYNGTIVFNDWKPTAKVTREDNTQVNRTYAIMSVPEDLGLTQFTETVEGNETSLNPSNIEVFIG